MKKLKESILRINLETKKPQMHGWRACCLQFVAFIYTVDGFWLVWNSPPMPLTNSAMATALKLNFQISIHVSSSKGLIHIYIRINIHNYTEKINEKINEGDTKEWRVTLVNNYHNLCFSFSCAHTILFVQLISEKQES